MVEIVSSGKNTQWHTFPNLQTKCTYSHIADEPIDFQLVAGRNCFLEVNKKSGFELLRTISKNGIGSIQRVKKRQMCDLQCGAPSKMFGSEIALGLSTGFIRIFSVQHNEFMPIKLKPDKIGNSVVFLDYSNCDEHLAALYDSGDICLYGLKTAVKTDVFQFDGASTIVRFHPAKRFALGIASYNGAVTMFDIQTKKKLFFDKAAHSSPTRDIAMTAASSDVFMSCGFDCNINIYDLRKRTMVQQYTQPHPLSTVALSTCGTYCVAGNLKGDIISYDFRNMKDALDTKRAHATSVIRVAFVPAVGDSNTSLDQFSETMNGTNLVTPLPPPAVRQKENTESFSKFIDLCINKDQARQSSPSGKRDSLFDFAPVQNFHDFSVDSMATSPSRRSSAADHSELRLKRVSRISLNNSMLSDIQPVGHRRESQIATIDEEKSIAVPSMIPSGSKRSRVTLTELVPSSNELAEIEEEDRNDEGDCVSIPVPDKLWRNKENRHCNQQDIDSFSKFIKESHVSTPNNVPAKSKIDSDALNMNALRQMLGEIVDQKLETMQTNFNAQLRNVETNVVRRIREAESEIKFYQDQYFHAGFKGNFNLYSLAEKEIDMLKEGMAIMLRDDALAQDYYRLKKENEELKHRLEKQ